MAGRLEAPQVLLHPARAALYNRLAAPMSLMDLAKVAGQPSSTARWHLAKLASAGLVAEEPGQPLRYRRAATTAAILPQATAVLDSVPAHELVSHVLRRPGHHLGEVAIALSAPRSRYWRVVRPLQEAGLLSYTLFGRRQLLYATPLAVEALRATSGRKAKSRRARRSRRPVASA